MAEAGYLFLGALFAWLGMGLLALSMDVHWRQVTQAPQASRQGLRVAGVAGLAGALIFCLLADHASMAALVWVMFIAASAFTVSMLLAWAPMSLRPLTLLGSGKKSH